MLTVVGGVYREYCIMPAWDQIFGSGGRAALLLNHLEANSTKLLTYMGKDATEDFRAIAGSYGLPIFLSEIERSIGFDYFTCLSTPQIFPAPAEIIKQDTLMVAEDFVLRFGMMEGDAQVTAKKAVYDPQSLSKPEFFTTNGSTANNLAVILNSHEAKLLTNEHDLMTAAQKIFEVDKAQVIIIKAGADGCYVYTSPDTAPTQIPAFKSTNIWTLGSGDIFSAAFTHFWLRRNLSPQAAARKASIATALYSDSKSAFLTEEAIKTCTFEEITKNDAQIYIAGPFFNISQRWLIEETRNHFLNSGVKFFSPLHDVGRGPAEVIAEADLKGLRESDVVLAFLDGGDIGTVFEIGYAKALEKKIFVLAQNTNEEDIKMITGSNCKVFDDYTTAIYHAVWGA